MVIYLLSSCGCSQDNHFAKNTIITFCLLKCSFVSLDGRCSALLNSLYIVDLKINKENKYNSSQDVLVRVFVTLRKIAQNIEFGKLQWKNTKSVEF